MDKIQCSLEKKIKTVNQFTPIKDLGKCYPLQDLEKLQQAISQTI